jgi:enoyl-CoA hydratase/carnithine racemase
MTRLAKLPMPTIAAIEGNALGGGLELALACDIRVASETARLGLPEVRLAVTPGAGGTQRLPRVVGVGRAKELTLTARIIDALEAERIGLVSRVVPAGEARAAADEIAAEIAQRGPIAVREAKRLIDQSADLDLDAGIAAEVEASERVFGSEDMLEGAHAFFEKRQPTYRGK